MNTQLSFRKESIQRSSSRSSSMGEAAEQLRRETQLAQGSRRTGEQGSPAITTVITLTLG
jgi:hypothetical protein